MTTRVHIVNLGPDPLTVKAGDGPKSVIYPGDSVNEYVYDTQEVLIKESKFDLPKAD